MTLCRHDVTHSIALVWNYDHVDRLRSFHLERAHKPQYSATACLPPFFLIGLRRKWSSPYNLPRRHRSGVEYTSTLPSTSKLDGGGWWKAPPGCFTPWKRPISQYCRKIGNFCSQTFKGGEGGVLRVNPQNFSARLISVHRHQQHVWKTSSQQA